MTHWKLRLQWRRYRKLYFFRHHSSNTCRLEITRTLLFLLLLSLVFVECCMGGFKTLIKVERKQAFTMKIKKLLSIYCDFHSFISFKYEGGFVTFIVPLIVRIILFKCVLILVCTIYYFFYRLKNFEKRVLGHNNSQFMFALRISIMKRFVIYRKTTSTISWLKKKLISKMKNVVRQLCWKLKNKLIKFVLRGTVDSLTTSQFEILRNELVHRLVQSHSHHISMLISQSDFSAISLLNPNICSIRFNVTLVKVTKPQYFIPTIHKWVHVTEPFKINRPELATEKCSTDGKTIWGFKSQKT